MATILHLLKGRGSPLVCPVVDAQRSEPGAAVTVVLLPGATPPPLPPDVRVRRVDEDLSWAGLLDLIFESDRVVTW